MSFFYGHAFPSLDLLIDAYRQQHQLDVEYYETLRDSFPPAIPQTCDYSEIFMSAVKSSIFDMVQATHENRMKHAKLIEDFQKLYSIHANDKKPLQAVERTPGVSAYQHSFVDHLTDLLGSIARSRIAVVAQTEIFGLRIAERHEILATDDDSAIREEILKLKEHNINSRRDTAIDDLPGVEDRVSVENDNMLHCNDTTQIDEGECSTTNSILEIESPGVDHVSSTVQSMHGDGMIMQVESVSLISFAEQEEIKCENGRKQKRKSAELSFFKRMFGDNENEKKYGKQKSSRRHRHHIHHQ